MSSFLPTIIDQENHRVGSVAGPVETIQQRQAEVLKEAGLPHDKRTVVLFVREGKLPGRERKL